MREKENVEKQKMIIHYNYIAQKYKNFMVKNFRKYEKLEY